jgi:hypothetical protein
VRETEGEAGGEKDGRKQTLGGSWWGLCGR